MARYAIRRISADIHKGTPDEDPWEVDDREKAVGHAAALTLFDYGRLGASWGCEVGDPHIEDGRCRKILVTPETKPEGLLEAMEAQARELGPIPPDAYQLIVLEGDRSFREASLFHRLKDARRAAAEAKAALASLPKDCPKGHGPLRDWSGKPRCWECGWPDKR